MQNSSSKLKVTIRRSDDQNGRFEAFEVPAYESQTVLDVVSWIQQNADPTLSYRFACRVGMCGSCAMMVNGTPRWTCRTHVKAATDTDELTIEPLRNLPVIKDLAVDMDPFFDKWVAAEASHHPTRSRADAIEEVDPASDARTDINSKIECINCSVCYAACDTVANNADYLGPAALQRAWTVYRDEKNADKGAVLDAVSAVGGCHTCHSIGSCTALCPNDLDPLGAIAGLKRATMLRALGKRDA